MKESLWSYGIVLVGIVVIVIMAVLQSYTTTDEKDYYLTKEIIEAAMIDAIDYGTYRTTGEVVMIKEKFIENFVRRFADNVNSSENYNIEFYEIYETPPKATVRISTNTGNYTVGGSTADFDVMTVLSGILETNYRGTSNESSH